MVGGCIKAEGGCEGGGNHLKYLKRGCNRKEGKGSKDFKGGQAGPRGGCLKKGGGWNPLTNYAKLIPKTVVTSLVQGRTRHFCKKSSIYFHKNIEEIMTKNKLLCVKNITAEFFTY